MDDNDREPLAKTSRGSLPSPSSSVDALSPAHSDDGGQDEHLVEGHRLTQVNDETDDASTRVTDDWALEAAAQELEARLANLRRYSNWRLNTRQYPSSPALETQHALWALRQTASGGLSLVLPPTIAEEEESEQEGPSMVRGQSLSAAIDEINGFMSRRATSAWRRSRTLASGGNLPYPTSSSRLSGPLLPLSQRQPGGAEGRVTLAPGIGSSTGSGRSPEAREGRDSKGTKVVEGERVTASATQEEEQRLPRDSPSLLRASLLSKAPPLWSAWERLRWTIGDYFMSLVVFVTISITWWRGAWNLLDYYVFPTHRALRALVLTLAGMTFNVLGFLCYPSLLRWSRRITCRRESYAFGTVKRLVLLLRMLASVAHWTGVWDAVDGAFCGEEATSDCSFDYSSLGTITCVGLAGLVALRQMNGAVWGPLFSVSLDFQDELVLDTSLRFHTNQWRTGGQGEGPGGRGGGSGALLWHVLDILATQWLPDVFTILAWYGLYTWLPLRWPGTSRREELLYVAAAMGVAVGCYAAQFVLASWVDAYYPRASSSGSSSNGAGGEAVWEREGELGGSLGNGRRSIASRGNHNRSTQGDLSIPLQVPVPKCCEPPPFLSGKYLAELLLYLWAFLAANMLWVFWWDFLDDHLLSDRPLLSNWLCAVGGLALEFMLNVASTEVAGGVYLDGAAEGSSGLFFPVCYFGEVAAYRASLRSAQAFAVYRKSTMGGLPGSDSCSLLDAGARSALESPVREIALLRPGSLGQGGEARGWKAGGAADKIGKVAETPTLVHGESGMGLLANESGRSDD